MGKVSGKKRNVSRQRDKRKREKALKRKRTRKPHSPQETLMPRTDDIAFIDQRLASMQEEVNQIGEKFQAYHGEVQEQIVELIREAGIFDEVKSLETERDEVRKKAEARIIEFQKEADELVKAKGFLAQREGVEAEAPQVEAEAPPKAEASEEAGDEGKVTGAAVIDKMVAEGKASASWKPKKVEAKKAEEPSEKTAIEDPGQSTSTDEGGSKKKRRVSAPDF